MRVHLSLDSLTNQQLREVLVVGAHHERAQVKCDGPILFAASLYDVDINEAAALLWSLSGEPA